MLAEGQRVNNTYIVKRKLGSGGFGEVYLADDENIPDRQVAIKVLTRSNPRDQDDLLGEMQTLARFNHPHIVSFYHHFTDAERLFLVMEYCANGSLHDFLESKGACTESIAIRWAIELCDTLAFVHGKRIVHHDIKPLNILFAADGRLKIGDFGIANRDTGTFGYMSPEMLLREHVARFDPRVDIYALGVTILEMLAGCHPFEEMSELESVDSRMRHDFIPRTLPQWIQEVLLKATHPTPELRFQSATDFAEAIRGRSVPYIFHGNRLKADKLARKSEDALARRKWRTAERCANEALSLSPDSVSALLAAGRTQLLVRRIDKANEYFSKALSISPRTPVQKELGWIHLEQGNIPSAISLLTDHLQRYASDFEAYNLLLKCFYLTNRYEALISLSETLLDEKPLSGCFINNCLVSRKLLGILDDSRYEAISIEDPAISILAYNLSVIREQPPSWNLDGLPTLKSKLIFEEYRHGLPDRSRKENVLLVQESDGSTHRIILPIASIGSLPSNDIVIDDPNVSRRHAVILNFQDDVWIYDLESSFGTFVDGIQVEGRAFLDGVHEVTIGKVPIRVTAREGLLL